MPCIRYLYLLLSVVVLCVPLALGAAWAESWLPVLPGGPLRGEERVRFDADSIFRDAATGYVVLRTAITGGGGMSTIILKAFDCDQGFLYFVGDWPKGLGGAFSLRPKWRTDAKYRVAVGGAYDIKSDAALAQRFCSERDKLPPGKLE